MQVKQIYEIVNGATSETLGKSDLLNKDLSNIVDVGEAIMSSDDIDNYVKSLIDHVGKVLFVERKYSGMAPNVLKDSWEYGSILEKVAVDKIPEAVENEEWSLINGKSYDPNVFYKPEVTAKFFNKRVTFDVPISITRDQVKSSFSSASQVNALVSMIYNAIDQSITVKFDSLVMNAINSMIADTFVSEKLLSTAGALSTGATGIKAINLAKMYNDNHVGEAFQAGANIKTLYNPDFQREAVATMFMTASHMRGLSSIFNIGGKDRFTSSDRLHTVLLDTFAESAKVFLQNGAGQFKTDDLTLKGFETVPYWQGSGKSFDIADTSAISVTTTDGHKCITKGAYIVGIQFDNDAVGICNLDREIDTNYNPKARFYSNFYHNTAGVFTDENENFVVYYIA